MKKIFSRSVALAILFALTACSAPEQSSQDTMIVRPSEFSEETQRVLELFDDEIMFFDFIVDETVKSLQVNVWVYENGQWVDKGEISGNISGLRSQAAIQVTENKYNIFTLDENGHVKYSSPEVNIGFENTAQKISHKITKPVDITVGKEITLWVKIGNDGNGISVSDDFRNSDCTAGIAFTVTFSNKEIQ